jgi:hypothetical protein
VNWAKRRVVSGRGRRAMARSVSKAFWAVNYRAASHSSLAEGQLPGNECCILCLSSSVMQEMMFVKGVAGLDNVDNVDNASGYGLLSPLDVLLA